jgi:hypothetical protein
MGAPPLPIKQFKTNTNDESRPLPSRPEDAWIANDAAIERLQRLGYTDETLVLVRFIPLVAVAWADGQISEGEREAIRAEARARGIGSGSAADRQLDQWLAVAPSEAFRTASVEFLVTTASADLSSVLNACHKVAATAGGLSGSCAISRREQRVLDRLADAFVRKGIASPHR